MLNLGKTMLDMWLSFGEPTYKASSYPVWSPKYWNIMESFGMTKWPPPSAAPALDSLPVKGAFDDMQSFKGKAALSLDIS